MIQFDVQLVFCLICIFCLLVGVDVCLGEQILIIICLVIIMIINIRVQDEINLIDGDIKLFVVIDVLYMDYLYIIDIIVSVSVMIYVDFF